MYEFVITVQKLNNIVEVFEKICISTINSYLSIYRWQGSGINGNSTLEALPNNHPSLNFRENSLTFRAH